jgi:hypothetical protein
MDRNEDEAVHEEWVNQLWKLIRHHQTGAYSCFIGDEGNDRVRDAYPGDAYAKLAVVKAKYDPENVFSFNQNIQPAATHGQATAA